MEVLKSSFHNFAALFKCPICRNLLDDAHIVGECGHVFCRECITDHIAETGCCATCNLPAYMKTCRRYLSRHTMVESIIRIKALLDSPPASFENDVENDDNQQVMGTPIVQKLSLPSSMHDTPDEHMPVKKRRLGVYAVSVHTGMMSSPRLSATIPNDKKIKLDRPRISTPAKVLKMPTITNSVASPVVKRGPGRPPTILSPTGKRGPGRPRKHPLPVTMQKTREDEIEVKKENQAIAPTRTSRRKSALVASGTMKAMFDLTSDWENPGQISVASSVEKEIVISKREAAKRVSFNKIQSVASSSKEWTCPACTVQNKVFSKRCYMCGYKVKNSKVTHTVRDETHSQEVESNLVKICITGLDEASRTLAESMLSKMNQDRACGKIYQVCENVTADVSHLISMTNEDGLCLRTTKYLTACLQGTWIVSFAWLEVMSKAKEWVDELDYEVQGDSLTGPTKTPARARAADHYRLFEGFQFYLYGDYSKEGPSKAEVQLVIKTGGGVVVKSAPEKQADYNGKKPLTKAVPIVIYDPLLDTQARKHSWLKSCTASYDVHWLYNCISKYEF